MAISRTLTPELRWEHQLELDVQIFDTDCFGVMWHGAYLKWMELGRARLLNSLGVKIELPGAENGHIYPVTDMTLKYKNKAPYGEKLRLTTALRVESFKLIFRQVFHTQAEQKVTLDAETTVLVLDSQWKIRRTFPDFLLAALLADCTEDKQTVQMSPTPA